MADTNASSGPESITRHLQLLQKICAWICRKFPASHSTNRKIFEQRSQVDSRMSKGFEEMKNILMTAPILSYPDFEVPFILDTDASDVGTVAVL